MHPHLHFRRNPFLAEVLNDPDENWRAGRTLTQIPDWLLEKLDRTYKITGPALGCGADACAWETQDGKVLKITLDAGDARTALLVKEDSPPGFVPVFSVFRLTGTYTPAYVIITEKVKPLEYLADLDPDIFYDNLIDYISDLGDALRLQDYENFGELQETIQDWHSETGQSKESDMVAWAFLQLLAFSKKRGYWMGGDAHPGNWGLNQEEDELILFDFGRTGSDKDQPIPEMLFNNPVPSNYTPGNYSNYGPEPLDLVADAVLNIVSAIWRFLENKPLYVGKHSMEAAYILNAYLDRVGNDKYLLLIITDLKNLAIASDYDDREEILLRFLNILKILKLWARNKPYLNKKTVRTVELLSQTVGFLEEKV